MKKFIVLLLLQGLCLTMAAGNIGKLYKSALSEKGMLFFLYEQKMPKCAHGESLKPLLFDVTYVTGNDTVSIKTTVKSKTAYKGTEVTITSGDGEKMSVPTEVIYRDIIKKGFINRIEIKIPLKEYRKLYNSALPYSIDYGEQNSFQFNAKQWKKHQNEVNTIWQIIDLNR